ncbi:hypothetical protein HQ545_02260 [Candidatus Woesearchaeota archaeon]|nr:hypothetical protein [Candidatus Woesearchaeota archaeon]
MRCVTLHDVRVTAYAFEKINAYSRIVSSMCEKHVKIMGVLLGYDDKLSIARNAVLLENQVVDKARAHVRGNSLGILSENLEGSGKTIVGMWHSHGKFPNCHSHYDNSHLKLLLFRSKYCLNNTRFIEGDEMPYVSSIVVNKTSYLRPCATMEPKRIEHYFCCAAKGDMNIINNAKIKIMQSDSDMLLDERLLSEDIIRCVSYKGNKIRMKDDTFSDPAASMLKMYLTHRIDKMNKNRPRSAA